MSRRYGRNQKRRARETIADLEKRIAEGVAIIGRQRRGITELEAQMNWAKNHLVRYSLALKPQTIRVDRKVSPGFEQIEIRKDAQGSDWPLKPWESAPLLTQADIRTPLPVLVARWKIPRDDGAMHVRVIYKDNTWGYGVTPNAWVMQDEGELIRHISEELAVQLTRDLRKWKDGDVF